MNFQWKLTAEQVYFEPSASMKFQKKLNNLIFLEAVIVAFTLEADHKKGISKKWGDRRFVASLFTSWKCSKCYKYISDDCICTPYTTNLFLGNFSIKVKVIF